MTVTGCHGGMSKDSENVGEFHLHWANVYVYHQHSKDFENSAVTGCHALSRAVMANYGGPSNVQLSFFI